MSTQFQATDDGPHVLLGQFNDVGEACVVHEITPQHALRLARELTEAALSIEPKLGMLSDPTIMAVKDYLMLATQPVGRINDGRSPCRQCGTPRGKAHVYGCNFVVPGVIGESI